MATNRIPCQNVLTDNELGAIDGFAAQYRGNESLSALAQFLRDKVAADLVMDQRL